MEKDDAHADGGALRLGQGRAEGGKGDDTWVKNKGWKKEQKDPVRAPRRARRATRLASAAVARCRADSRVPP